VRTEDRRRLAAALRGVDGWLELDEAWGLYREAGRGSRTGRSVVVEIGAYKGRSTIALGLGIKDAGGGRLISIDPHEFRPGQYDEYLRNVEHAGIRDVVTPVVRMSHDARSEVADGSVRLLFVDGSHEYADVVQDVRDWESALADGAVVAFNDPYESGVGRALRDTIGLERSPFRSATWIQNTLFVEYAPARTWSRADAVRLRRLRAYLKAGRLWHRMHWKIVTNPRVPTALKTLQLRAAQAVLGIALPRKRA
jgi:hypothetical protein